MIKKLGALNHLAHEFDGRILRHPLTKSTSITLGHKTCLVQTKLTGMFDGMSLSTVDVNLWCCQPVFVMPALFGQDITSKVSY